MGLSYEPVDRTTGQLFWMGVRVECGSEVGEREGHGVLEAVEDVDLLLAGKDEFDGMPVFLELEESLSADAAGCCGLLDEVVAGE